MNTQYNWKEQKKPYTIESKNFTIDDRSRRMMREINSLEEMEMPWVRIVRFLEIEGYIHIL